MRRILIFLSLIIIGAPPVLALYAFLEARRMPVVKEATIALPDWPKGAKPVTAVLIADIHIGSLTMDAGRLTRIVARINELKPDLVLIAGDFVNGHDTQTGPANAEGLRTALAGLKPKLGSVAVFGNHDLWTGVRANRAAVTDAGVTLLSNSATVRGPIKIIGVDDHFTGQADIDKAFKSAAPLNGAQVVLSHSPDIDYGLPQGTKLLLAGHSHCGQVQLPWYGPLIWVTRDRDSCGVMFKGPLEVIVTAGLGTSGVPFRLAAPPDLWLLHLGPKQ